MGDWHLDASLVNTTKPDPTDTSGRRQVSYGSVHGYFYRVVGVNTPGITGSNSADYEVQQPIRGFHYDPIQNLVPNVNQPQYQGGVIVLEGVADVYDRGLDRKFD